MDHYVTHSNRGGLGTASHDSVWPVDGKIGLVDAIVGFFESSAWKTGDWGCLLSFSKWGLRASLVIDE